MGKALIITEKPSVAADITKALGGFEKMGGGEYYESDTYVCTYAVGHLLGLFKPEDIDPAYQRWSLNNLPIIPESFELTVLTGQNRRLNVIKRLMKRRDVDAFINACDAGREGELIFREIVEFVGLDKPVKRLWLQSMTRAAIREGFERLRSDSEMQGLTAAAKCRSQADWLIGMNATRAFSVKLRTRNQRKPWTVGRVQTPTLALLVDRELEILDFEPEAFWRLKARFRAGEQSYEGTWYDATFRKDDNRPERKADRIFEKALAEDIAAKIEAGTGTASETHKTRKARAPQLFNLTALQKTMSSGFGWSAKRTLQAAQRCYEKHKVLTYPRTSSFCLPEDYVGRVTGVIEILAGTRIYAAHAGYLIQNGRRNENRIFDDARVADHFAIIPTGKMARRLAGDDQRLFDTVVRRFLAAFYPPAIYDRVERVTVVNGQHFKTGPAETLVKPGWVQVYERMLQKAQEQKGLYPLAPGKDKAKAVPVTHLATEIIDDATKPPPRIGEARLLSLMEHAGRYVKDEELSEALVSAEGLGTAATRADIIEKLKTYEYVYKDLVPTPKGIRLIDTLYRMAASRLTSAELTAQLELDLEKIEKGDRRPAAFIGEIENYVVDVVDKAKGGDFDDLYPNENPLGQCPVCTDKRVYEKSWFYACESNTQGGRGAGCGLLLWKNVSGRYLNRKAAVQLIEAGKTEELSGFRRQNGRPYKARLVLHGNEFKVEPAGQTHDTAEVVNDEPLGICPVDQTSRVIETKTHFISEAKKAAVDAGNARSPGFILPKTICKRDITRKEAAEYLRNGETPVFNDFISRRGRRFKAKLKLRADGRHRFEFAQRRPRNQK